MPRRPCRPWRPSRCLRRSAGPGQGRRRRRPARRPGMTAGDRMAPLGLLAAGTALGIALVIVLLWPDGATPRPGCRRPGPAHRQQPARPPRPHRIHRRPAPSAPGVPAALANLTAVITTARQQGTADQQAEDLLDQAADLANARPAGRNDSKGDNKDEGQGKGVGKGQEAAKAGRAPAHGGRADRPGQDPPPGHHPDPTGRGPAGRGRAAGRLSHGCQLVTWSDRTPALPPASRGLAAAGSGRPAAQPGLTGSTRRPGRVRPDHGRCRRSSFAA